jgi:hypothetical protein
LAVWTEDEAGPYQTAPYAGEGWHAAGQPLRLPHEHLRNGTAKLLVLFEPASGQARVQGVSSTANAVLHPWMKQQLHAILEALPAAPPVEDAAANRRLWQRWQEGLRWPLGLPEKLPALRLLLVLDNLAGHLSQAFVCWMFAVGIMPLYTPFSRLVVEHGRVLPTHPQAPRPGRSAPPTQRRNYHPVRTNGGRLEPATHAL